MFVAIAKLGNLLRNIHIASVETLTHKDMSNTQQSPSLIAWLILLMLALVWGSSFILIKRALLSFNYMQVGTLRILIAGLCLSPFLLKQVGKIPREKWKYIAAIGIVGNGAPAFLLPLAQSGLNSATVGILNSLVPLFTLVLGVLFFRQEFVLSKAIGVLVGFAGAVMLVLTGGGHAGGNQDLSYTFYVLLGTACYGTSVNIMKRYLNDVKPIPLAAMALMMASIPYALYFPFSGILDVMQQDSNAWRALGFVAILAAMGTAIALVFFNRLIQLTEPLFATSVTYLIPIVALIWGLIDGELFGVWQFAGMCVILLGVYLVNRKKSLPLNTSQTLNSK